MCRYQVSLVPFVEESVISTFCAFNMFLKKSHHYSCVRLFVGSLFYSIGLYMLFCAGIMLCVTLVLQYDLRSNPDSSSTALLYLKVVIQNVFYLFMIFLVL